MIHHFIDSSVERDFSIHWLVCRNHTLLALFKLFQQVSHAFACHETTIILPVSESSSQLMILLLPHLLFLLRSKLRWIGLVSVESVDLGTVLLLLDVLPELVLQ